MAYRVIMTRDASDDLDDFIGYLLRVKKNRQAAQNVLDDFEATKESLSYVANSLKYCENPHLKKHGYRKPQIFYAVSDLRCGHGYHRQYFP